MRAFVVGLILICASCPVPVNAEDDNIRFAALDIYLTTTEPVAAWQFELSDQHGLMKVVGVEKGDSPAFARAPYYDREAVRLGEADRIVVADYSLANNDELPFGRIRIATVHLMLSGDDDMNVDLLLTTAATYDGRATDASISFEIQTGSDQ